MGDAPATALAQTFVRAGFRMGRLKTGTPPRLRLSSIDLGVCDEQYGDDPPKPFSFMNSQVSVTKQVTLDPLALNPQPSTQNPKPDLEPFGPQPKTLNLTLDPLALNPQPSTQNPKPDLGPFGPEPSALNPKP